MVVSKLASGLQGVIKKISSAVLVDKKLVQDSIKELQRTLLSADVNVKLVLEMSERIEKKVLEEKTKFSQKEHLIKVVYDELVSLMGKEHIPKIHPQKILLVGIYGHGKTTTCGKLAKFYSKRGLKTAIINTDTYRPAAYEQVEQIARSITIPMFGMKNEKQAKKILEQGLKEFSNYDVIIVDSAGRDSVSKDLLDELKEIDILLKPHEKYLVIGADIGQAAAKEAKEFNDAIGLTGVIVTRLDSSAKGGGALSACAEAGIPITFIGTGEKLDDFEIYNGTKYISRLLGYPDLETLLSRMKEVVEEEISPEEFLKGDFTLKTFYKQLEATKKMGSFTKIFEQLGLSAKLPPELVEQSEEKISIYKYIMDSMTKEELENPEIIDKSRTERIAKGSGRKPEDVRELLKQYKLTKKMFQKFKKGRRIPKELGQLGKIFKGFSL